MGFRDAFRNRVLETAFYSGIIVFKKACSHYPVEWCAITRFAHRSPFALISVVRPVAKIAGNGHTAGLCYSPIG